MSADQDIPFISPQKISLRFSSGTLELKQEETWEEVSLVRQFPFSEPSAWLSVLDSEQKEIGVLKRLDELSSESLAAAQKFLEHQYLIPKIQKIESCSFRGEETTWEVKTNRGNVTFKTGSLKDNLEQLPPNRLLLKDKDGNRYEIPDVSALDASSRSFLDNQL
jgi:hypothetical protein